MFCELAFAFYLRRPCAAMICVGLVFRVCVCVCVHVIKPAGNANLIEPGCSICYKSNRVPIFSVAVIFTVLVLPGCCYTSGALYHRYSDSGCEIS